LIRPDARISRDGSGSSESPPSRARSSPSGRRRQHRVAWEPPGGRAVRAAWTRGGGRCYSLASASVEALRVHPLSSEARRVSSGSRAGMPARRRLATSWMRTLRAPLVRAALVEPSRDASRPLTPHVASRHRRVGSLPDRQLQPHVPLSSTCGLFDRETRIVPPSPRVEEPSPLCEKMEERLEAPSVVSVSLLASADARGVSAARTRRLSAPDRVTFHAVPMTFWRGTRAPFRSSPGATQGFCGVSCAPCGSQTSPPLATRPLETRSRSPRQRTNRFATG